MRFLVILPLLFSLLTTTAQPLHDIQGHRGCRGLLPENSIPGFIEAVKLGVNTLEMDVVITKDGQVVLSHDPYMSDNFCSTPDGKPITEADKKARVIYSLTYEEVKKYDCGSRGNSNFPEQQKMSTYKPLLADVIDAVEKYIADNHLQPVQYNIETKSTPEGDGTLHPAPAEFMQLVYEVVKQKSILSKVIIQSFDPRTLIALKKIDPTVKIALLVGNVNGFKKNLAVLGFKPDVYSPLHLLVNKALVKQCHAQGIQIIPWTVNEEDRMLKLKKMGTDGVITDYPNRAIKVLR